MDWLQPHFVEIDSFPRPDWDAIHKNVETNHSDVDQHLLWCGIAEVWLGELLKRLPDEYDLHESENFIFLTLADKKYVDNLLGYLEKTLKRILRALPGIASDDRYGKHAVLMFDNIDQYYSSLLSR